MGAPATMKTFAALALALAMALTTANADSSAQVDCAYGDDPSKFNCITDTGNSDNPLRSAFYKVNVERSDDSSGIPNPCYTSVYDYSWDTQHDALLTGGNKALVEGNMPSYGFGGNDTVDGYSRLETHQYVFTGPEYAGGLYSHNYKLKIDVRDDAFVDYFMITFIGNDRGPRRYPGATTTQMWQSVADMSGDGVDINLADIMANPDFEPVFGNYSGNPLHISVIPMLNGQPAWGGLDPIPALTIWLDANGDLLDNTHSCEESYQQWCNPGGESMDDTICCYLQASPSGSGASPVPNTMPYDEDPSSNGNEKLSGRNGKDAYACFRNEETRIRAPYEDRDGKWISSLNNLFKATQDCDDHDECPYYRQKIKIVVDPRASLDFPLSNVFLTSSGNGYDVPGNTVEITGYGRLNGLAANKLLVGGYDGLNEPEYAIRAKTLWLSGDGGYGGLASNPGNNAWQIVEKREKGEEEQFVWANGAVGEQKESASDPSLYSIRVQHVQVGYGAPLGDAPIVLGDNEGSLTPDGSGIWPDRYGASVFLRDVKYISFSMQADGPSMHNPASYGTGLFIHGADELLKSVTGSAPDIWWQAYDVTFFAGFKQYGSLACPCCFTPGSGYQGSEFSAYVCENVIYQDVSVPLLMHTGTDFDSGLITTRWNTAYYSDGLLSSGDPYKNNTIEVQNLVFKNWKVFNNKYNLATAPLVNIVMASDHNQCDRTVQYLLKDEPIRFENVFTEFHASGSFWNGPDNGVLKFQIQEDASSPDFNCSKSDVIAVDA